MISKKLSLIILVFIAVVLNLAMFFVFTGNTLVNQTGPISINIFFIILWLGVFLMIVLFGSISNPIFIIFFGLIFNLIYWYYGFCLVKFLIKRKKHEFKSNL